MKKSAGNKPVLRVMLVDFWQNITLREKERYLDLFRDDYDVYEVEENPDLLVYSCFGERHFEYEHIKRLFICGENVVPDFNTCDYAIGTVKMQYADKSLWIPEAYYTSAKEPMVNLNQCGDLTKRKFCSFIYSQDTMGEGARLRRDFCSKLMKEYKHVDCPGKILHNMESDKLSARENATSWHDTKIRFMNDYKFNIAFENSSAPGYITEKLVDCYKANVVPIYWGSCGDAFPYPKESMICANDYPDLESLCARVKEVDENDELYLKMLAANPYRKENFYLLPDFKAQIRDFVRKVVEETSAVPRSESTLTDAYRCKIYVLERNKIYYKVLRKIKKFYVYLKKMILNNNV